MNFSIRGELYEKAFDLIASQFLSVVRVSRAEDYGIDAYCHLRRALDAVSSGVGGAFCVQVGGPGRNLQFGGNDQAGKWKEYEIEWLRSLAVPLYFARVTAECDRVDFYSLWPVWRILGGSRAPFRIVCELDDVSNAPTSLGEPRQATDGTDGDRQTYQVPIGPPFLSLSQGQLVDEGFKERARDLMSTWLRIDRLIVIRLLLRIRNFQGVFEWFTNDLEPGRNSSKKLSWMGWDPEPGQNIDDICEVLEPVVTNLGTNLQHQDDPTAYKLIPILEWLRAKGQLSTFGVGLLGGLIATQLIGKSPRPEPISIRPTSER